MEHLPNYDANKLAGPPDEERVYCSECGMEQSIARPDGICCECVRCLIADCCTRDPGSCVEPVTDEGQALALRFRLWMAGRIPLHDGDKKDARCPFCAADYPDRGPRGGLLQTFSHAEGCLGIKVLDYLEGERNG